MEWQWWPLRVYKQFLSSMLFCVSKVTSKFLHSPSFPRKWFHSAVLRLATLGYGTLTSSSQSMFFFLTGYFDTADLHLGPNKNESSRIRPAEGLLVALFFGRSAGLSAGCGRPREKGLTSKKSQSNSSLRLGFDAMAGMSFRHSSC